MPAGPGAEDVVHQVAAQLAAGVAEPVGKRRLLRVEQDPGGLERRGAEEDDPGRNSSTWRVSASMTRTPVARSRRSSYSTLVHHAVRPEREAAGALAAGRVEPMLVK